MRSRYINTKFWSDAFIGELAPDEKLLFLYFLTNEHTNISGIYELALRVAAFETGLDQSRIEQILTKFENKIGYHCGYIIVKNFYKHQQKNPKITAGIAIHLKELPPKVLTKLYELKFPVADLQKRAEPKDRYAGIEDEQEIIKARKQDINSLFDIFYKINPEIKYGNAVQRKILEGMIDKYGYDYICNIINYAVSINGQQYAPVVTNPSDLQRNFGKIVVFYKKEQANKPVVAM